MRGETKLKPTNIKGDLSAAELHIGVVVSQFNNFITDRLLAGALDAMERAAQDAFAWRSQRRAARAAR